MSTSHLVEAALIDLAEANWSVIDVLATRGGEDAPAMVEPVLRTIDTMLHFLHQTFQRLPHTSTILRAQHLQVMTRLERDRGALASRLERVLTHPGRPIRTAGRVRAQTETLRLGG